ncbi:MAG: hypothetical protein K6G70_05380 [Bacteroidaceae bacterium]|nr:hypothetical protein [Bacteroidaceae bacterium]
MQERLFFTNDLSSLFCLLIPDIHFYATIVDSWINGTLSQDEADYRLGRS